MTTKLIRSPGEWVGIQLLRTLRALYAVGLALVHAAQTLGVPAPAVRRIRVADLRRVLVQGYDDFSAYRGDVFFLLLLYPALCFVLARIAFGETLVPLLFPIASGLILVGPVAAIGLYEMSRQREQGLKISWFNGIEVLRRPAIGAVALLSLILAGIFALWLKVAWVIFQHTMGPTLPSGVTAFVTDVLTTEGGHAMIVVGVGVGFLFALLAMAISLVSLPLLVDRDVGLDSAITTSFRAVAANPLPVAAWSAIVVVGLVLGALPGLLGLIVVIPVLGHATWHLYRSLVKP